MNYQYNYKLVIYFRHFDHGVVALSLVYSEPVFLHFPDPSVVTVRYVHKMFTVFLSGHSNLAQFEEIVLL